MVNERIINTHTEYIDPKNLFTNDEQIDQCCEPVSVNACADVGRVSVYEAAESKIDLDALKEKYQAKYPNIIINDVVLEDVGPDGPCGTMYETWEGRLNCCDEAEPLVWEASESVEVITDNSSGAIKISGGRAPYAVSVRGSGFYLDANHPIRDGTTVNPTITIYTADACGSAEITVSDGCSSVAGYVRSDNGQWIERYRNNSGGATGFGECPVTFRDNSSDSYTLQITRESGKWSIYQAFARAQSIYAAVRYGAPPTWPMTYDEACAKSITNGAPGLTEDRITGSCFEFEHSCEGCESTCHTPLDTSTISFDVGHHSYKRPDSSSPIVQPIWAIVQYTVISEWVC